MVPVGFDGSRGHIEELTGGELFRECAEAPLGHEYWAASPARARSRGGRYAAAWASRRRLGEETIRFYAEIGQDRNQRPENDD